MATWKITQMERLNDTGLVIKAFWKCDLVDQFYAASDSGVCELQEGDSFISFDELTEESVLSWVWELVDKEDIENKLLEKIEEARAPQTALGLPWNN